MPGETFLSGIVGQNGITGRLGDEEFPGDAFVETVERGLAISMQENGFPEGEWDIDDDEQFPGDAFSPGETIVDVSAGEDGISGRLGEEAFPGDAFVETIESGLAISMQEDGFPSGEWDIDDEEQFPGDAFSPGNTWVDVAAGEDGIAGRLDEEAFPGDAFIAEIVGQNGISGRLGDEEFPGDAFIAGIVGQNGITGRLGNEAFPGDAFVETIERGLAISMQENGFPEDEWDIDDDEQFPGDAFSPGETIVDVTAGEDGITGRLGEEGFPGDAFVESIEKGLAVTMSPNEAFPGDAFDEQYPSSGRWEPGESFANVLGLNVARTVDPEYEFLPDPEDWFPGDAFQPAHGETTVVAAIGGSTAERLGEEAFPGDAFVESIEKGLAISMQEDGFPGGEWDIDDEEQFPGDAFSAGDTWIDVAAGRDGIVGRMSEEAFPGDAFVDSIERGLAVSMSPEVAFPGDAFDEQYPDQWISGKTFANVFAVIMANTIDRDNEFWPHPRNWFPDEFDPDPDTWFPGDDEAEPPGQGLATMGQYIGALTGAIGFINTQFDTIDEETDAQVDHVPWPPLDEPPA